MTIINKILSPIATKILTKILNNEEESDWILADGTWNDSKFWVDTDIWNDS